MNGETPTRSNCLAFNESSTHYCSVSLSRQNQILRFSVSRFSLSELALDSESRLAFRPDPQHSAPLFEFEVPDDEIDSEFR